MRGTGLKRLTCVISLLWLVPLLGGCATVEQILGTGKPPPPIEKINSTIGNQGGTVETRYGARITFDEGVFQEDTPMSVMVTNTPTEPLPPDVLTVGSVIQIEFSPRALSKVLQSRSAPQQIPSEDKGVTIEIPLPDAASEYQLIYVVIYEMQQTGTTLGKSRELGILSSIYEGISKVVKSAKRTVVKVAEGLKTVGKSVRTTMIRIEAMAVNLQQSVEKSIKWIGEQGNKALKMYRETLGLVPPYEDLVVLTELDPQARLKFSSDSLKKFLASKEHMVILVHGMQLLGQKYEWSNICSGAWKDFAGLFYSHQVLPNVYDLFCFEYFTGTAISQNGESLASRVKLFKRALGNRKVVIVAHSMGGLVAKSALVEWDAPIDAVITLGTPYHGSPLANIPQHLTDRGIMGCVATAGQHCGLLGSGLFIQLALETPGFQQLKWDGFDGSLQGENRWLSGLNQNHSFDDRFIAYASKDSKCYGAILLAAKELLKQFGGTDTGDCVVPFTSALFRGDGGQQQVGDEETTEPNQPDHFKIYTDPYVLDSVLNKLCEIVGVCFTTPPTADMYQTGVDIMLVLDRSSSMQGEKIRLTKEAASIFVSLMNPGDRIGVVSFSNWATIDSPLTEIDPEGFQRDQARDAISRITAEGSTSIGDGLWQAASQLRSNAATNRRQAIVLFTDGGENRDPCVHEVLPLIPKTINIYTVSFGKLIQEARSECPPEDPEILLRRIARSFNGWHSTSATLVELQALYAELSGAVTGRRKPIQQSTALIKPGERQEKTVFIDPSIKKAAPSIYWTGSDIGFYLRTPDGTLITPETVTAPSIRYREGPTFKSYEIESPQSGTWTMIIEGRDVPSRGELYVAQVTGESSISLAVDFDREDYSLGQLIILRAMLNNNGLPITTAIVQARIEPLESAASRFFEEIRLYDDGQHNDSAAGDGVFGGTYMPLYGGVYRVAVEAVGTIDLVQPFARMTQRTFYVSEGR